MKQKYQFQDISSGSQAVAFVDQSAVLTPTTGTPSTGQFRSSIIGRASIPDIANDMRASLGIDRVMTQQIYQIQNEAGPNGEPVWGVPNDDGGLIRFVGGWFNGNTTLGLFVFQSATTDYAEVTFWGTGLNFMVCAAFNRDFRVSVDGGSEGSTVNPNDAGILGGRKYSPNLIITAVSGLSLGIHTVKIRSAVSNLPISGFEIINSNTSGLININPGTAYYKTKRIKNTAADAIAYNTGVTGTKGGRIVRYFTDTNTVSQAFTAVNAAIAYGSNADHTNEEVARVYMPREFGAGRYNAIYANQDDFSLMTSARAAAFTLDDGTTTLVTSSGYMGGNPEGLYLGVDSNSIKFTFVGCGLDLLLYDSANGGNDSYTYQIDGGTATAWFNTAGNPSLRVQKIVSGLSYGTHTFTFNRVTAVTWYNTIVAFKVYQPKKPTLPTGAVEICDYNVMGNYAANTTAGLGTLAVGVLRKYCTREMVYVSAGTWTLVANYAVIVGAWQAYSSATIGSYVEYTFFGVGFEIRGYTGSGYSANVAVTIDTLAATTANFSSLVSSAYGGMSFSAGVLNMSGAATAGSGVSVSGLPLGKHTVRFQTNSAVLIALDCLDIITPIHVHKSNGPAAFQNTLAVGSQGLTDSRALSPVSSTQKAWAQAVGVTSTITTSSTSFTPCPDMSCTVKTSGGPIQVSYSVTCYNTTTTVTNSFQIFLNGVLIGRQKMSNVALGSTYATVSDSFTYAVGPGTHKIDLGWSTSGGALYTWGDNRNLTVREI